MLLFYGDADRGKTSLAAQFPGVVFARVGDVGVTELQRWNLVDSTIPSTDLFTAFEEFDKFLTAILEAKDDERPKALCLDGLGGVAELAAAKVVNTDYDGNWTKFNAFGGQGVQRCVPILQDMIAKGHAIRKKGTTFIMLAHADTFNDTNPTGDSFIKLGPKIHRHLLGTIIQEVPNIGCLQPVIVTTEDGTKTKAKGTGRPQTVIHFVGSASMIAKNKIGITAPISLGNSPKEGYANLMAAVAEAAKRNKESIAQ